MSKYLKQALVLSLLALGALVTANIPDGVTAQAPPTNRIFWDGQYRYIVGANVPWYNWQCDFGCGANGGVSSAPVRSAVDQRVQQFRATGMNTLRWFVFESSNGSIWQIRPGANGQLEIDPMVYTDIDAALAIAAQRDVYLVFNLFSFSGPEAIPQAWINDPAMRTQLVNALGPLFSRYGQNPRLMAWDIFNEPEWDIWDGSANESNVVTLSDMIADSINARGNTLVTIGSAMLDGLPIWRNVSLDFYSPHWYDYMGPGGNWDASSRTYASINAQWPLDGKPLVIGEWYAPNGTTTRTRYNHWLNAGYAGAWGWSIFPERTQDAMQFGFMTAAEFMAANPGLNPTPTPSPTPTATTSPSPTPTPKVTPTPTPRTYRCQIRNANGSYTTVWVKAGGGACP